MIEAAYVISQSACAIVEMQAMVTANKECEQAGKPLAYIEKDFMDIIEKYGIYRNAVVPALRPDS